MRQATTRRTLLTAAAFSLLLGGCGASEIAGSPRSDQAQARSAEEGAQDFEGGGTQDPLDDPLPDPDEILRDDNGDDAAQQQDGESGDTRDDVPPPPPPPPPNVTKVNDNISTADRYGQPRPNSERLDLASRKFECAGRTYDVPFVERVFIDDPTHAPGAILDPGEIFGTVVGAEYSTGEEIYFGDNGSGARLTQWVRVDPYPINGGGLGSSVNRRVSNNDGTYQVFYKGETKAIFDPIAGRFDVELVDFWTGSNLSPLHVPLNFRKQRDLSREHQYDLEAEQLYRTTKHFGSGSRWQIEEYKVIRLSAGDSTSIVPTDQSAALTMNVGEVLRIEVMDRVHDRYANKSRYHHLYPDEYQRSYTGSSTSTILMGNFVLVDEDRITRPIFSDYSGKYVCAESPGTFDVNSGGLRHGSSDIGATFSATVQVNPAH